MTTLSGLCIGGPWHGQQRAATHYRMQAIVHQSGDACAPVYTEWKDAPKTYSQIRYNHHVVRDGLREPFALWLADGSVTTHAPRDADELVEFLASQIKPAK